MHKPPTGVLAAAVATLLLLGACAAPAPREARVLTGPEAARVSPDGIPAPGVVLRSADPALTANVTPPPGSIGQQALGEHPPAPRYPRWRDPYPYVPYSPYFGYYHGGARHPRFRGGVRLDFGY